MTLSRNLKGACVLASQDLPEGTEVGRFEGPVLPYAEVPEAEIIYVIAFEPHRWLIPGAPMRFVNHSCEPNCEFRPDHAVVTLRPVKAGEELTISYDWADPELLRSHPEHFFWDPRWSFACHCGAPSCRGVIDRYRIG